MAKKQPAKKTINTFKEMLVASGVRLRKEKPVKTRPAKKAKRKAVPGTIYVVLWNRPVGPPWLYFTSARRHEAEANASLIGKDCEVITYRREVLPRTRTRKGER